MADFVIPTNQRDFRCTYCEGKIVIPRDLPPTTGPCPHCGGIITSPGNDSAPAAPVEASQETPATAVLPAKAVAEPVNPPATPVPVAAAARPATTAPPAIPADLRAAKSESSAKVELPHRDDNADLNKPKKHPAPKLQRSGVISAMLVLLMLSLLAGGVVYFASKELGRDIEAPTLKVTAGDSALNEADYIHSGWQKDAYQLLRGYLAAATPQDKLPFILNSSSLAPKVVNFYGGSAINDSDTPAEAFSIYELSDEDYKRGLFMMNYDQPAQFDIREFFRPLASLEVQHGLDDADPLLGTLARAGNFAKEPLRVYAFFKRTPEGLKLDWEIFAQTKYRTLQDFVELPEVGQTGIFRVMIVEDVPEKGRVVAGTRTYRVADPANTEDNARINVKVDSEIGRALSIINWRGTKENRPVTRTATVELKWSGPATAPELEISRFVCWEFLGLGGQDTPATASTQ